GAGDDDLPGRLQLQAERGVEDVGAREPVVDPAPGRAGAGREDVDERGDVVVGDLLAPPDVLDGEGRGADRREVGLRRAVHRLAGGDLDAPPRLHAGLVGPDRAELGTRVPAYHRSPRMRTSPQAATDGAS